MSSEVRAWIGTVFRVALAVILFWAGFVKLLDHEEARRAIIAYRVFPAGTVDLLAYTLPAVEVLLAALLLVGLFTRWAALVTALLMVGFIVGISSVWIRGYSIDCGCFGGGGDVSPEGKAGRYTAEIVRDAVFAAMALWLVAWPRTRLALDRFPDDRHGTPDDDDADDADDLPDHDLTDENADRGARP